MARPTRQGIDYFSLDVHLDDKFRFIEIKYKLEGFAIIMKLLQKIYSSSYWYKWSDDEALLFADENRTDYTLVNNVVNEAIDRGIFHKGLYENHGILTSKGIQKRYKEAVRRRKEIEIIEEYLLIDNDFGVNDVNNSINDSKVTTKSKRNDGKSTQSKVNQSKTNNKTSSQKFSTSDMENAELLFKRIQQNNPDVKKPKLDDWANTFRMIREIDKRTDEQIKYLINWTQTDDFWQSNVLSPSKLRKQWDQLVVKVKGENAKKTKQLAIGTSKGSHDWESVLEELGDE